MQHTPWHPMLIGPAALLIALALQVPNLGSRLAAVESVADVAALLEGPIHQLPTITTNPAAVMPTR